MVFPARTTLATVKLHSEIHSSSLASLESVTQSHLADRPQPINSSHGLSVPTALEGSKVRFPRAFACPPRSAFRVWLPSWRFTPFVTRAGFISHRQRSWDLPFGAFSTRKVPDRFPDRMDPHTVYPAVDSECRSTQAGSASRGFWALTLARVPGDPHVFSMPSAMLPWVFPSQGYSQKPGSGFRPTSSHALRDETRIPPPAPQSIDQLLLVLILPI